MLNNVSQSMRKCIFWGFVKKTPSTITQHHALFNLSNKNIAAIIV